LEKLTQIEQQETNTTLEGAAYTPGLGAGA